tara:strand:+ start:99 stop:272 length:174 start_codon:yes stop_codon:yes gene_type:complete
MTITDAKYWKDPETNKVTTIICKINNVQHYIPINSVSVEKTEIDRLVKLGNLVIESA